MLSLMPVERECTMPSIKTMVYILQVKQLCWKSNPESETDNMTRLKQKDLYWGAWRDFPCSVVKTKLPEEMQTELRLSRVAPIHNLAFLAHHYHKQIFRKLRGHCTLLGLLSRDKKTHLRLPKNTNTLWLSQSLPLLLLILAALFL